MNIRRVALIFLAGVIAASCSEKSDFDRDQNSQAEEAKPGQDVPAVNEERPSEFEVERSSTSEAESAEAEAGNELEPPEEEIGEDCVAFLRATVTVAAKRANGDCPQCPVSTEATEVLKFGDLRVDGVSCSESTCEVFVTIHGTFNPSTGEEIAGGLIAWIPPEQRERYLRGETPSGQQVYKVKVIYRRDPKGWRVVEFDRP